MTKRTLEKIITANPTSDGDGVKISRSLGSHALPQLDPFLLLDELGSDDAADYIGGFPPHPHRGFETVTYMLEGQMRHKDSAGNEGVIRAGGIQWMTAGSGIIHSEMPEQSEGTLWGFQLWINLPAAQKMRAPRYQEIESENIPEATGDFGTVRIMAGEVDGISGAVTEIATQPTLLDLRLNADGEKTISLPKEHAALLYVYKGNLKVDGKTLNTQQLGQLSTGETVTINAGDEGLGALLIAAAPLKEPIARMGPFVMNTEAELQTAYSDYRRGKLVQTA